MCRAKGLIEKGATVSVYCLTERQCAQSVVQNEGTVSVQLAKYSHVSPNDSVFVVCEAICLRSELSSLGAKWYRTAARSSSRR